MEGDDVAYLEAARTVDDRAHSAAATDAFREALRRDEREARAREATRGADGVRVLEAGAGTCGVLRRLVADGALPAGEWVAVDTDERVLSAGRRLLAEEAAGAGYGVDGETEGVGHGDGNGDGSGSSVRSVRLRRPDDEGSLLVRFEPRDARAVAADGPFDGVVGRSFADLLDPAALVGLLREAAPDGWYHLPLTFDGETALSPPHPADDAVLDAYHGTMRNRGRAATLVAERVADAGTPPAVDARSDWVVTADDGEYEAEEGRFLRVVLDTVVRAVEESGAVPERTLEEWETRRRAEVRRGDLGFVARNRDLFGRVP